MSGTASTSPATSPARRPSRSKRWPTTPRRRAASWLPRRRPLRPPSRTPGSRPLAASLPVAPGCGSSRSRLAGDRPHAHEIEVLLLHFADAGEGGVEIIMDGQVPTGQGVELADGDPQDEVRDPRRIRTPAVAQL